MATTLHPDAGGILARLRQERIPCLYHFTSIENLPLICRLNGLCSKQRLQNASLWPCPNPGGDDLSHTLDRRWGNWDKVGMNLTPRTPMCYRKKRQKHLCFFVLLPDVATHAGVVFANTNATATGHQRAEGLSGLDLINFAAVRAHPRPWDKDGWHRPVQAEILVPDYVALDLVTEVVFVSPASLQEGERLWGNSQHPPFRVDAGHFADLPSHSRPTLGFPNLVDLILTFDQVDKSNVKASRAHVSRFHRSLGAGVTAIASVY